MSDMEPRRDADRPGGPDFMARLRESVSERAPETDPPAEVRKYAPPAKRSLNQNKTRNQTIAEFIIALPWREAMAMGKGIQAKLKKGEKEPTVEELTAAIQEWAWEHETFEDEARPTAQE